MNYESKFYSLSGWLAWLEEKHPETNIELGLERIKSVAVLMNLLKPAPFVVTIAGTNGKGSTVALLEKMLLSAGYSVGVYTSPHVIHFNERVRINGRVAGNQLLCSAFAAIDEGRGGDSLTYFEFCTLVALQCFSQHFLDYIILEVGLGGSLDATNIIDSDVAVITTIGLDHQDWLGNSLESIGYEKAGIIRYRKNIIYGAREMPASIEARSIELDAPLFRRGYDFDCTVKNGVWFWSGVSSLGDMVELNCLPLPALELDNAATALQVLQFLPKPVTRKAIISGLETAALQGRYQTIHWRNNMGKIIQVVLDVAHNPQAVERLSARLRRDSISGQTRAVIALCSDKDYINIVDLLAPQIDSWIITEFASPRGLSAEELAKAIKRVSSKVVMIRNVVDAFTQAVNQSVLGDRVLVTGSFLTVAPVLAIDKKVVEISVF